MSENRIRKYTNAQGIYPKGGPHSVGFEYNADRDMLAFSTGTSTSAVQYVGQHHFATFYVSSTVTTQNVFIAPVALQVVGVQYANEALSTNLSVTLQKATSTTAPGAGTALHTTAMFGTTAINSVVTVTLTSSTATLQFAAGDRMVAGVVGSTNADMLVTYRFKRI